MNAVPESPPERNSSFAVELLRGALAPICGIAFAFLAWGLSVKVLSPYVGLLTIHIATAMILAVSLNIVNGMAGQFSIGHAGFMAIGGYTAAGITYYGSLWLWGSSAEHGGAFGAGEWLFVFSCLIGGLVAAAAGFIVGLPSLRLRGDYLAIVTLGFGEICRVLLQQTNDVVKSWDAVKEAPWSRLVPPPVGGSLGFNGVPKYTNLFWVALFLSLTVIVASRLKQSGIGRAMLALREDEIAAQAMGVNITRVKVSSFVIAALIAGIAGGLYAHTFSIIISPIDAGFQRSFDYVIMTVLGGKGSITGVLAAAALLTALPEVLREFEKYRMIVYALLLIVMMLVRPQGLFGSWEIWDGLAWFRRKRAPEVSS